jgi:succinate dehydrogenase flavin-adding protein (antitoxin of CptAB toxin-antitoxin module)
LVVLNHLRYQGNHWGIITMQRRNLFATDPVIQVVALQYAEILDQLSQQALNDFLKQTDADIIWKAMGTLDCLDWNQETLRPQLLTQFQEAA